MKATFLLFAILIVFSNVINSRSTGDSIRTGSISVAPGVQLEYAEKGDADGIPVIFLHGLTDSWHSYEKILPMLPGNIHAFAITFRGHGNSSKPENNYRPADLAADIAAFIKAKNIGAAIIIGHSMGGVVAQKFALDYPLLTKGLVIVDSDAAFKENPDLKIFLNDVMRLTDPVSYEFAEAFQSSTVTNTIDSTFFTQLVMESTKVPARVWQQAATALAETNYLNKLKSIYQPTLILWGDKDTYCLKESQDRLHSHIQNSKLVIYDSTGHALHWEKPERFANDITEFVNSIYSTSNIFNR